MRVVTLILLIAAFIGGAVMTKSDSKESQEDNYDYRAMRTVTALDIKEFSALTKALRVFAQEKGCRFVVTHPSGGPDSIMFTITHERFEIVGGDRLLQPGLEFFVYWQDDVADDQALDAIAEQLRQVLAPFGTTTVTSALPGTRPREESTNLWRRK